MSKSQLQKRKQNGRRNDEDDDDIGVEHEKRKRMSTTATQRHNQQQQQDDDDDHGGGDNDVTMNETTAGDTLAELSQINDIASTKRKQTINTMGVGTIEHVEVKNFKCHSALEFDLGKNINFILGRNGSGKSAVMDAVILCLGGNAKSTGRQANAKTFIKTNHDRAEVCISIRNEGDDSYKPHVYGERIIIERRIASDGVSNYKILSSSRQMISNKRVEIDNIAQHFNIQADNPICFLNQETSKHFLNSSNKSDRYKLFMKASQLESMKQMQIEIERERVNCLNLIEEKESHLPKLEEELYQWEDKYKKCQSIDNLKKRLNTLMGEYTWCVAIDCEKTIEGIEKEKRYIVKNKDKHEEILTQHRDKQVELLERDKELKKQFELLKSEISGKKKEREAIDSEHKKASQNHKQVISEMKKYDQTYERKKNERQMLQSKYNEEKQNTQYNYQDEKIRHEEKLKSIRMKISELQSQEKTKLNDNELFKRAIEHDKDLAGKRKFDSDHCDRRIKGINEEITNLKQSEKNFIAKFGQNMVKLCEDIESEFKRGKFKKMPRGPLGAFIEPLDTQWSLAIEQCLGGLIQSFVCSSYEDERVLYQLIERNIRNKSHRPKVIVTDFNAPLYDVNKYRPSLRDYPTVYEMLKIKDPIVANTLCDQRKIESILLLPNFEAGREIMERNLPRNCQESFLTTGDQIYGHPSYRVYACKAKHASFYVQSIQSSINQKMLEIKKIEEEKVVYNKDVNEINERIKENMKLRQNTDAVIDTLKRQLAKLTYELRQEEQVVLQEPADLAAFEEEISKLDVEINEIEIKREQTRSTSKDVLDAYEASNKAVQQIDNDLQTSVTEYKRFQEEKSQIEDQLNTNVNAIEHYDKLFEKIVQELNEKQAQVNKLQIELVKFVNTANELCSRVDTKRTTKIIETEITQIEKQIELTENMHGSGEDVARKYIEMRNKYNTIVADISKQKQFLKKLKNLLSERSQQTLHFIQSRSVRCAVDFSGLIASRDYNGTLKFDHKLETLDIIVHPNKSKDAMDNRDLKSLSGGERSFSTISFLLALWTIVESPIIFLDEFDVFMDDLNRQFAVELILNTAKERLSGQYVFLTPQDMSFLKTEKQIKIFKMPDPTRGIDLIDNNENRHR